MDHQSRIAAADPARSWHRQKGRLVSSAHNVMTCKTAPATLSKRPRPDTTQQNSEVSLKRRTPANRCKDASKRQIHTCRESCPEPRKRTCVNKQLLTTRRKGADARSASKAARPGDLGGVNRVIPKDEAVLSFLWRGCPTQPRATPVLEFVRRTSNELKASSDRSVFGTADLVKKRRNLALPPPSAPPAVPDVDLRLPSEHTALTLAAMHGRVKDITALLDANPNVNVNAVAPDGNTTLMLLLIARYDLDLTPLEEVRKVVARVLKASTAVINHQNHLGQTALHLAVVLEAPSTSSKFRLNHRGCVDELLNAGADAHICDKMGDTPLMVALQCGKTCPAPDGTPSSDCISYQLLAYSSASSLTRTNVEGKNAVSLAAEFCPSWLKTVMQRAVHCKATRYGPAEMRPLLRHAAAAGESEIVKYFLERGAGFRINSRDQRGRTFLHYAAAGTAGHDATCSEATQRGTSAAEDIISALLDVGADVNAADASGRTPLMLAGLSTDAKAAAALLTARPPADVFARDSRQRTVLHYHFERCEWPRFTDARMSNRYVAARKRARCCGGCEGGYQMPHPDRVKQLLDVGGARLARAVDCDGRSALLMASAGAPPALGSSECAAAAICRLLISYAPEMLEQVDHSGMTPLLAAARTGNIDALRVLLEAAPQSDVALEEVPSETALLGSRACANPDARDSSGRSALLLAIGNGHGEVASELLKAGAFASLRDLMQRQVVDEH